MHQQHHLELKPDQIISNRYTIKKVLGFGGVGAVYLVSDQHANGRLKALKVIKENYLNLEESRRFSKEFQLLYQLKHPGIVYCDNYGRCKTAGDFFTMEFIDWQTLDTISDKLSLDLSIRILYDLADVLTFIHDHQIAHYDLKPNNIFVDIDSLLSNKTSDNPIIKISDFELAERRFSGDIIEHNGAYIYSAPEMYQSGKVDTRADLFSFGMIGFELLTKSHPYSTKSDIPLLQQKQQWLPNQITWDNVGVPPALSAVLTRCLNPNQAFRPRNASEVLSELSRLTSPTSSRQVRLLTSPFIGRVGVMRHLGSIMHEVNNREQWAFLFYGDSEIGKSRLINEFVLHQQLEGVDVVHVEGKDLTPLFRYSDLEKEMSSRTTSLADSKEILRQISYRFEDNPVLKPLVLCWHRFDKAGINLMQAFKENLLHHPNVPILWLLESEDNHKELSSLSYSDHLIRHHLKPLGEDETEELIGELLMHPHNYQLLSKHLFRYVGGKPGWLLYVLKQLINKKHIIYQEGNWHILDPNIVSSSQDVKELLKVDLNKLSASSRWVIEWLATLNQELDVEEINSAMGLTVSAWSEVINELKGLDLIEVTGGIIRFCLPVLRESIYKSITLSKRHQLHLWVGRWLEENKLSEDNIEVLVSITRHYHFAKEPASFLRIIERILELTKNTSVMYLDSDLLKAALDIQEIPLKAPNRYRCYELLAKTYLSNKRHKDSAEIFQLLLSDNSLNKYGQIGIIHLELGRCLFYIQEYDGARYHLSEAFDLLEMENVNAAGQALRRSAYLLYQMGKMHESLDCTFKYRKFMNRIVHANSHSRHLVSCGKLFILHNRLEEAYNCFTQVTDKVKNPWDSPSTIRAYRALVQLYIENQGDWKKAINVLDFLDKQEPLDSGYEHNWYNSYLRSMAFFSCGQIEKGMKIYETIELNIKAHAKPVHQCRILLDLIRIDYFRGYYWQGMCRIRQCMGIARRLELDYMQAVIHAWTVRYRDIMKKQSDKLIEHTEKLIVDAKHTLSNCLACFLLSEHYLDMENCVNADRMINNTSSSVNQSDFSIPIPLLELIKIRAQVSSKQQEINKNEFEKWVLLSNQIIHKNDKGAYYFELMQLAIGGREKKLANTYLKTAVSFFKDMDAHLMVARCKEAYGNACIKWKCPEEAQQMLSQAAKIYRNLGLPCEISLQIPLRGESVVTTEKILPLRELSEVIELLNTLEDPKMLTHKLLNMALKAVDAKRGLIMYRLEKTKGLSRRASVQVGEKEAKTISHTLAKQVFSSKIPVFSDDAMNDDSPNSLEEVKRSRLHAVACLPIISKGEAEGVLYLDHRGSVRKFTDDDRSYLKLLTNLIGTVLTHSQFLGVLKEDVKTLRRSINKLDGYDEFKGRSKSVRDVFSLISRLREHDMPVLILGESGTGKELIARIIHQQSKRPEHLFIALNCGAFQDTLLESELFGHVKGAFTDAKSDKEGLFKKVDGGTIFLDEMDQMSQQMQVKLLRAIQEGEYIPVGDTKVRKADVRIIAAAKQTLPEKAESGKFREDLFYRINVVQITLPPLRERIDDIPLLVEHFIDKFSKKYNRPIKGMRKDVEIILKKFQWPGNVRQLENIMNRVFLFVEEDGWIEVEHLPEEILAEDTNSLLQHKSLFEINADRERKIVLKVLKQCDWNRSKASRMLKISLSALIRRINIYNLKPEDSR